MYLGWYLWEIPYWYTTARLYIENTTRVPIGDDLSYNEWFLKRI